MAQREEEGGGPSHAGGCAGDAQILDGAARISRRAGQLDQTRASWVGAPPAPRARPPPSARSGMAWFAEQLAEQPTAMPLRWQHCSQRCRGTGKCVSDSQTQSAPRDATLKFKMPQDVYLSLFQASGTGRRLLSVRNKTAPIGFTAFNIFRKEMKLKSLSLNEIAKKWRELDEHARQEYYDKVEEEVTEDEETNGNSTTTTGRNKKKKTSNKTKSKATKKNITIPFLHEVRRFEDLNELTRIFGPATLRRNVGTILTPTGRIHVAHVVTSPVRFKYDGQKGELGMQFDYKVEYVHPL